MRGKFLQSLASIATLVCAATSPVSAQFAVCNQTLDVINVALGAYDRDAFETSGWWTIGPNQCANVINDTLTARYFYVYAKDVFGRQVLAGSTPMCVAPDRFEIRGEQDCLVRGLIEARFHEVDTRKSERWTVFIYPPPP
ncbi:DUF1036 domain-containing protein [Sulfitobacter sp. F26204]|uniref:DUF1036 domain-containing protein n=1 Tax=Sulfitobacter sp. F26204 TaxID=2996014 RepID=UPI00225E59EE|nr:DUF1036 domain-containing protein [Sulfitobacter sp. F26204]MCX7561641.1 DUF1036 domain-containing protein [Sulfitobacter sp. F26204]